MGAPRRWIRLDVGWHESDWLADLPPGARLAWVLLLDYVKRDGVGGTVRALTTKGAARRWRISSEDVDALVEAAVADGALVLDEDAWTLVNWRVYQDGDSTAALRQRRHREKKKTGQDWTDGKACENCGSVHDLTTDHIVPKSRGGTNDPSNLRVLCRTCNSKRGNRSTSRESRATAVTGVVTVARTGTETGTETPTGTELKNSGGRLDVENSIEHTIGSVAMDAHRVLGMGTWGDELSTKFNDTKRTIRSQWVAGGVSLESLHHAIHGLRIMVDGGEVEWLSDRKGKPLDGIHVLTKEAVVPGPDGPRLGKLFQLAQEAYAREPSRIRSTNTGPQPISDLLRYGGSSA